MNIFRRILYLPLNVQMVVTRRCNLSCKYCNEYDNKSPPVPLNQLKKWVDKLKELGTFSLTFTGGEPLLHPKIFDLASYSKERIPIVTLITNGFLLTKEKIVKLNEVKLNGLQISIDGVQPNKNTVKVLKYLEDKLILLKKYASFIVNVNTVIGSTGPEGAFEVIKFVGKTGLKSTVGLIHDENGQIKLNKKEREAYFLVNSSRKKPFWEIYNFEKALIKKGACSFKCRAGARYLYVDEFGLVNWCSQKRGVFTKPLVDYSYEDLKKQFYKNKKCSAKCTVGCVRRASFFDNWRRQT